MGIAIIVIMFLIIWGWVIYELYYAPIYDENEMPIKDKPKRIKHRFHINETNLQVCDVDENDINQDLGYKKRDMKEDVK